MTEPDGPLHGPALPPLESDDAEWVAARWHEYARGAHRHWGQVEQRRVRSSARALRQLQPELACLDVLCRKRNLLARVYEMRPGQFDLAAELVPVPEGGHALTLVSLEDPTPIAIGCRCGQFHQLDPQLLLLRAREGSRGSPQEVSVSHVVVPT